MTTNEISINVTFRHLDATEAIREHAEQKIRNVARLVPGVSDVHVILSSEPHHHRQSCEIVVHAANTKLTAHDEEMDLYAAIDKATSRLASQAKKLKGRVVNASRRASPTRRAG